MSGRGWLPSSVNDPSFGPLVRDAAALSERIFEVVGDEPNTAMVLLALTRVTTVAIAALAGSELEVRAITKGLCEAITGEVFDAYRRGVTAEEMRGRPS